MDQTDQGFEYRIIKHLRNVYSSPLENYLSFLEDQNKGISTADLRRMVFDNGYKRGGEMTFFPMITFGQFNVTLFYHGDKSLTQRDINLISGAGDIITRTGDISAASHAMSVFRPSENRNDAVIPPELPVDYSKTGHLSDKPFFAVIAVTVRPEAWKSFNKDGKNNSDYIMSLLCSKVEDYQKKTPGIDAEIYHSLHTADFIIAARSAELEAAFGLSVFVTGNSEYFYTHTTLGLEAGYYETGGSTGDNCVSDGDNCGVNGDSCGSTGDNRGVTGDNRGSTGDNCVSDGDNRGVNGVSYKRLSPQQVKGKQFLVKFSCLPDYAKKLVNICKNDPDAGFLAGYNDVVCKISGEQFNCLYPMLCEYRLFKGQYVDWNKSRIEYYKNKDYHCGKECKECVIKYIGQELRRDVPLSAEINGDGAGTGRETAGGQYPPPMISDLSIEAIIDGGAVNSFNEEFGNSLENIRKNERKHIRRVRERNLNLLASVEKLRRLGDEILPVAEAAYASSIGLLLDLLKIYLPMGAQSDLYMNGKVIYEFAYYLSVGIYNALNNIAFLTALGKKHPDKGYNTTAEKLSEFTVEMIRRGVDAINVFARLTQTVNLQFFSSANYELYTRLNAQKLLLAYSEYIYELSNNSRGNGNNRHIRVLLNPNVTSMLAESFRLHPHDLADQQIPDAPDAIREDRAPLLPGIRLADGNKRDVNIHPVIFRLPGFEQFLRVYETLPNLHHELKHFSHFNSDEEQKKRNESLIMLICSSIAELMLLNMLQRANIDHDSIITTKYFSQWRGSISETLAEDFKAKYSSGIMWEKLILRQLEDTIITYLEETIGNPDLLYWKSLQKPSREKSIDKYISVLKKYLGDRLGSELEAFRIRARAFSAEPKECAQDLRELSAGPKERAQDLRGLSAGPKERTQDLRELFAEARMYRDEIFAGFDEFDEEYSEYCKSEAVKTAGKTMVESKVGELRKRIEDELKLSYSGLTQALSSARPDDADAGSDPGSARKGITKELYNRLLDKLKDQVSEYNGGDMSYGVLVNIDKLRRQFEIHGSDVAAWWQLPEREIKVSARDELDIYREFVSDAFMCATLELNFVGYVYAIVRIINRASVTRADSLLFRRVQMVILAMTGKPGFGQPAEENKLGESLNVFFTNQLAALKANILVTLGEHLPDGLENDIKIAVGKLCGVATGTPGLMKYSEKDIYYHFPSLKMIAHEKKSEITPFSVQLSELFLVAEILAEVRNLQEPEPEIVGHAMEVFATMRRRCDSKKKTRPGEKDSAPGRIINKISAYYNGSSDVYRFTPREMLDDAVKIINEYYYRNRFRMAKMDLSKKVFRLDK